jgi:hypothetical protein
VDLKLWNSNEFGNIHFKHQKLLLSLHGLESTSEMRDLSEGEVAERIRLTSELEKNTLLEEICCRQKSWVLWLKEGDKNTKYFHKVANSHHRHNSIRHLSINGELSSDMADIKAQIIEFYKSLYTEDVGRRTLLDDLQFSSISSDEIVWLERPFEEEEVFHALSNMNGDKAPGPDSFPMSFFHACWPILRADLLAVFRNSMSSALLKEALMLHSLLSSLRRLMLLR